ncbi:hypothetical protein F4806DRAFT_178551 [Annulohypoxylon nitens]|nr:hypothetical protein F4806DRAFT_178551 [Annulohypoxylon nitens]
MAVFADLPPEIRTMVWQFCLPGPRTVIIEKYRHTRAPVVLHICRESRLEARRHSYELAFPASKNHSKWGDRFLVVMKGLPVIWFNFSLDRLCLDHLYILSCDPECRRNFHRVRSVGLPFLVSKYDQLSSAVPVSCRYYWSVGFPQAEEFAIFKFLPEDYQDTFRIDRDVCGILDAYSQGLHSSLFISGGRWSRCYEEEGRFGDLTKPAYGNCRILLYHRNPRFPGN